MTAKSVKKSRGSAKILYRVAMVAIISILTVAIVNQYMIGLDLKEQETKLITEISKEQAIGNSLKNQQANQNDPEFIEKIAREKLNMVKPNEIVFIDKNTNKKSTPTAKDVSENSKTKNNQ